MIAYKAITPKAFAIGRMEPAIRASVENFAKGPLNDFRETVATWTTKPDFQADLTGTNQYIVQFRITIEGDASAVANWDRLDVGVPAHTIKPKNAPVLVFQGVYKSKTLPGTFSSRAGGKSGDYVYARAVRHPGIEARGWRDLAVIKYDQAFEKALQSGMDAAAKASGHGF